MGVDVTTGAVEVVWGSAFGSSFTTPVTLSSGKVTWGVACNGLC